MGTNKEEQKKNPIHLNWAIKSKKFEKHEFCTLHSINIISEYAQQ